MSSFITKKIRITMKIEIRVPQIGESITEAQIARWFVSDGEKVVKDQDIVEIDSDKTSISLVAPTNGIINILVPESEVVKINAIIAVIDEDNSIEFSKPTSNEDVSTEKVTDEQPKLIDNKQETEKLKVSFSPLAEKKIEIENLNKEQIVDFFLKNKLGVKDVDDFINQSSTEKKPIIIEERTAERRKMSMLRKKIATRLVSVKNETAMLTSFNEVDMSGIIELRNKFSNKFSEVHGVKLGFMSFFAKAVALSLKKFPMINSIIENDEIVEFSYVDISIAVSTEKGLMVPVVRNVDRMSISEIENSIYTLAEKARNNKLSIEELEGGTFTITNGGVFGSLMSTPIINPPQSAILGMHTIQDRAVVVNSQIVIRPMMYVALSYDHRLIDGKDSVGFLIEIKKLLENPALLLNGNTDYGKDLLSLQ